MIKIKIYSLLFLFISFNSFASFYSGIFKIGQPYKIKGILYTPKIENQYNKDGIASWYGDKFHNKLTANGEIFNKYDITAAHKTLPLPSIAKVKNLENGKFVIVRINDRGPFVGDRIIDLSFQAASIIGMVSQGTAKVNVEFLLEETNELHLEIFGKKFLQ